MGEYRYYDCMPWKDSSPVPACLPELAATTIFGREDTRLQPNEEVAQIYGPLGHYHVILGAEWSSFRAVCSIALNGATSSSRYITGVSHHSRYVIAIASLYLNEH